jgi:hypothetical protein
MLSQQHVSQKNPICGTLLSLRNRASGSLQDTKTHLRYDNRPRNSIFPVSHGSHGATLLAGPKVGKATRYFLTLSLPCTIALGHMATQGSWIVAPRLAADGTYVSQMCANMYIAWTDRYLQLRLWLAILNLIDNLTHTLQFNLNNIAILHPQLR